MQDQNEKTFSKLPLEIIGEIVEKLDPISRVVIRNVSKLLRAVSDKQKLCIQEMQILEESEEIFLRLNGVVVKFPVLNFLKPILSNPKLKIDHLHLIGTEYSFSYRFYSIHIYKRKVAEPKKFQEIIDIFKGSSIHVKSVKIDTDYPVAVDQIVSLTKPGVLDSLEIDQRGSRGEEDSVSALLGTAQFKQAKSVNLYKYYEYLHHTQVDAFLHLDSFQMRVRRLSPIKIKEIRDILAKRPNFETCKIRTATHLFYRGIEAELGEVYTEGSLMFQRHPIHGSTDYLLVTVYFYLVSFERNAQSDVS